MSKKSGSFTAPATPAATQPSQDYQPTAEESELIRLSQEWMDVALVGRDEPRLREMMSPDFTLQIWDASRAAQTLDAWMDTLLNHLENAELNYDAISAHIFNEVGVVYSRFSWHGLMDSKPFKDSGFMVDVWQRQNGNWRIVSRRSAPLQQVRQLVDIAA